MNLLGSRDLKRKFSSVIAQRRHFAHLPPDQQMTSVQKVKKELRVLKKEVSLAVKQLRELYRARKAKALDGFFSTAAEKRKKIREDEQAEIMPYQRVAHLIDGALIDLEKDEIAVKDKISRFTWSSAASETNIVGGVYLLKSGPNYKIGKAAVFDERIKQIKLLMPEPVEVVHKIYTQNPAKLERHWHMRFFSKRTNGEWFRLSDSDIAEFKGSSKN